MLAGAFFFVFILMEMGLSFLLHETAKHLMNLIRGYFNFLGVYPNFFSILKHSRVVMTSNWNLFTLPFSIPFHKF